MSIWENRELAVKWLPMDIAPKDGRRILLLACGYVIEAEWDPAAKWWGYIAGWAEDFCPDGWLPRDVLP